MSNYNLPPAEANIEVNIEIEGELLSYLHFIQNKQPHVGDVNTEEDFLTTKIRHWIMQEYAQFRGIEMAEGKKREVEQEKVKMQNDLSYMLK